MNERPSGETLASLSQTELLYRAYRASEALGAYPDDTDLENYDRLMSEVERRAMSVETRLGTLRAEVADDVAGYPGITVSLEKPDGSRGLVSWTEVGPESDYAEGEALHTFAYNGDDELPVTVACDPRGPWMDDPSPAHAGPAPAGDWLEKNIPILRAGDDALVFRRGERVSPYVIAQGYDPATGHWSSGSYRTSLAAAAAEMEGLAVYDPETTGVYDRSETLDPAPVTSVDQLEWILLDNGFGTPSRALCESIYELAADDLRAALRERSAEVLDHAVKERAEGLIDAERRLAEAGIGLVSVSRAYGPGPEDGRPVAAVLDDGEVYLRRPGTDLPELLYSVEEAAGAVRPAEGPGPQTQADLSPASVGPKRLAWDISDEGTGYDDLSHDVLEVRLQEDPASPWGHSWRYTEYEYIPEDRAWVRGHEESDWRSPSAEDCAARHLDVRRIRPVPPEELDRVGVTYGRGDPLPGRGAASPAGAPTKAGIMAALDELPSAGRDRGTPPPRP